MARIDLNRARVVLKPLRNPPASYEPDIKYSEVRREWR